MKITETNLPGVLLIEPVIYRDERGFFVETHREEWLQRAGIEVTFVQDNHSRSTKGVLRGLHYQEPHPQGKLVRCARGSIFDVAVDIRRGSPQFGRWYGVELSDTNGRVLWIPPGFAHGLSVLTDQADVMYKCTEYYDASSDRSILWNDGDIGIVWPVENPRLSAKDASAPRLKDAQVLPLFEGVPQHA